MYERVIIPSSLIYCILAITFAQKYCNFLSDPFLIMFNYVYNFFFLIKRDEFDDN